MTAVIVPGKYRAPKLKMLPNETIKSYWEYRQYTFNLLEYPSVINVWLDDMSGTDLLVFHIDTRIKTWKHDAIKIERKYSRPHFLFAQFRHISETMKSYHKRLVKNYPYKVMKQLFPSFLSFDFNVLENKLYISQNVHDVFFKGDRLRLEQIFSDVIYKQTTIQFEVSESATFTKLMPHIITATDESAIEVSDMLLFEKAPVTVLDFRDAVEHPHPQIAKLILSSRLSQIVGEIPKQTFATKLKRLIKPHTGYIPASEYNLWHQYLAQRYWENIPTLISRIGIVLRNAFLSVKEVSANEPLTFKMNKYHSNFVVEYEMLNKLYPGSKFIFENFA